MRRMVTDTSNEPRPARVLYITYDGLTDPLGRSQILPYLVRLAERGHHITILSCEKPARMDKDGAAIRKLCDDAEIEWRPLAYHKRPPILSAAIDANALRRTALRMERGKAFDIVHCRSYIAARAGLALKQRFGVRLLFDMRGFWPDEKVEGHNWDLRNPLYRAVYRSFKRLESRLLRDADHIISLTEAGRKQLLTRPELAGAGTPITVIPCCVEFSHFPLATAGTRATTRDQLGLGRNQRALAYLGSLGSWYMLDEMLDFFRVYAGRHADARFLFITPDEPQSIRKAAERRRVDPNCLIVVSATRDEVPRLLAAADLAIFFIRPVFSKTASSPTKMGEMLAVGLPLVTNAGVGDVAKMVTEIDCGAAISEFTDEAYERALDDAEGLTTSPRERRRRALPLFDVDLGVERYDLAYRDLLDQVLKPTALKA